MNKNVTLAIAGIVAAATVLIYVLLSSKHKENFTSEIVHSPNSKEELRKRSIVDDKLKEIAKSIKGTAKTPIYIIDDFLSGKECDAVIDSATDLFDSELTSPSSDKYFRTSKTADFTGAGIQPDVDRKVYDLVGRSANTAETTQIQHYKLKNEFKDHVDAFDRETDHQFWKNGQRTWTVMIYLNDVPKGGTTEFKKLKEECVPKKGRAVVWSSLNEDGSIDHDTLHCGTPVLEGEKWITTTWFLDTEH